MATVMHCNLRPATRAGRSEL